MTKIIVSYDGTDNDDDALALARVLGSAGASPGPEGPPCPGPYPWLSSYPASGCGVSAGAAG